MGRVSGRSSGPRAVCVGGGITGVLTARELLRAGFDVTLLEAQHVGAGSSSRTAAGIRQQFSTATTVRGMRYSVRFYKAFAAEIEDGIAPIVQNGYLFLYDEPARWTDAVATAQLQRECGLIEVETLEGPALRERFPFASPHLLGATFCPTDGFLLPHVVYNEGARRVRELGGRIEVGCTVVGAVHEGTRLTGLQTSKGLFEADVFLDCTNAWSPRLAKAIGAETLPIVPLKRYLWFVARDGSMRAEELLAMPLTIGPTGVYCRPENSETLMLGKKHAATPEPDFTYEDQDVVEAAHAHTTGLDATPIGVWSEISEAVPPIGEFGGLTATTCGYYATTPDHNPFLGYDRQVENLIRLVGFSGHGAMFGPFSARVAGALAEAGHDVATVDLDGESVSIDAFRLGRRFGHSERMVI